jgi:hypothetical protein
MARGGGAHLNHLSIRLSIRRRGEPLTAGAGRRRLNDEPLNGAEFQRRENHEERLLTDSANH